MSDLFSLAGRVALVTGASRGLGLAMAEALGSAGARLALNARDAGRLDTVAQRLRGNGIEVRAHPFDVADEGAASAAVAAIERDWGRLDILVCNAGINIRGPVLDYKTADFAKILQLNLQSAFVLAREAGRGMVARGAGRIIMITSVMGRIARPNLPAYSAAKAGLDSLTRQMAVELGPRGVTVNAIAPGFFATDMNEALLTDAKFTAMVSARTPVGRWGEPHELGGAAVFLASDAASYVNGHTLYVDGGMTAAL